MRLLTRFKKYPWRRIGLEAIFLTAWVAHFFPYGADLRGYYLPFARGCLHCGFVPYYAQWLLWPLTLIPSQWVWPIWIVLSALGFWGIARRTGARPWVVLLSFPAVGQFYLGQIDVIVTAGLALALLASNPWWRGVGLVLALVKPQISALAVVVLLLQARREDLPKMLAAPVGVFALSMVVYGFTWPVAWLQNALQHLPPHLWRLPGQMLWPYGLVFLPAVGLFKAGRRRFEAALVISALATPFFSVYSYLIFLTFRAPWWSLPLSYAWLLMWPWYGKRAIAFAWVLPLGLLLHLWRLERKPEKSVL